LGSASAYPNIGAIVSVHAGKGFFFSNPNGGWEYPAFWLVTLVMQTLRGDGAYAKMTTPVFIARTSAVAQYHRRQRARGCAPVRKRSRRRREP
jgi:hypothetical protein